MGLILDTVIKDSAYKLTQFSKDAVEAVESKVFATVDKNGNTIYKMCCQVRKKDIVLKPEEVVRQLYIWNLVNLYGYDIDRMELERHIHFGREVKRADIVIFDKVHKTSEEIIIEIKKPTLKEGKEQLKSYCNATGAIIGVWTNGDQISYYHRKDPNYFEDIPNIPKSTQKLKDILNERWTIKDLISKDKLVTERKSLKGLIQEMEDEVLANAGVDVFEEVFKLIYTKLFDEMESGRDKDRALEFRNYGDTEDELKDNIQALFDHAKEKWPGVFNSDEKINLSASHLSVCVASLQDVKLFNSNLDIVDDAFEYLMSKSQKGEKGQYFTPRYVIEMCVKMLNPKANETIIDTAAGSCGFPVHTIFHVWKQILEKKGINQSHLFTAEKKPAECEDYVQNNVFAIDFDAKAVRVARTLNLIAGDGKTNVMHLNTLDYDRWDTVTKEEAWQDVYYEGWKGLKKLRATKNQNRDFNFDIVMANPPFAGDIKESRIITKYELGKNAQGKYQTKVGRDILFIERNFSFLKPGGRMAVVLPQGRFNNSTDKFIRNYIAEHGRILAVIGLHGNVFKPHTGTKTSVLFVQKWTEEQLKQIKQYKIDAEKEIPDLKEIIKKQIDSNKKEIDDKVLCSFVDDYFVQVKDSRDLEEIELSIVSLSEKINLYQDDIANKLNDVKNYEEETKKLCAQIDENKEKVLADITDSFKGEKSELRLKIKDIKAEYKEKVKACKEQRKLGLKQLKDQQKSYLDDLKKECKKLDKELQEEEYNKRTFSLEGQLQEILSNEKIFADLWERYKEFIFLKKIDYPIFFGTMREPSKDNSGEKIYVTEEYVTVYERNNDGAIKYTKYTKADFVKKYSSIEAVSSYCNSDGTKVITTNEYELLDEDEKQEYIRNMWCEESWEYLLDKHDHLIAKHDLFNHDGLTKDGIAEAFEEFAKKEGLDFFK